MAARVQGSLEVFLVLRWLVWSLRDHRWLCKPSGKPALAATEHYPTEFAKKLAEIAATAAGLRSGD